MEFETIASIDDRGPFTYWSGKIFAKDTQQFPPFWGHPGRKQKSFVSAFQEMWEVSAAGDTKNEHAVIADGKQNIVFSLDDPDHKGILEDLRWLVYTNGPVLMGEGLNFADIIDAYWDGLSSEPKDLQYLLEE